MAEHGTDMASLKHIHIIGSSPRSGTTLLAEAMATCFDIDAHCPHEESIATPPPVRSGTYLSKQPGELLAVRLPLAVDRDLRVLCMFRDPRDVCISRHGSAPDRYWCSMRYWHLFLRHLSWLERHPRVLCIRYEDLVDDPDAVQDRIIDFLPDLPALHRFSRYHEVVCPSEGSMKALRGVRPIRSASVGGWRRDPRRIKHQLAIHGSISKSLIRLGYEMDNSWERALMGIDECALRTRLPETFEWKFLIGRRWRGVVAAVRSFTRRIMFASTQTTQLPETIPQPDVYAYPSATTTSEPDRRKAA